MLIGRSLISKIDGTHQSHFSLPPAIPMTFLHPTTFFAIWTTVDPTALLTHRPNQHDAPISGRRKEENSRHN
jgi:hypothetical protein